MCRKPLLPDSLVFPLQLGILTPNSATMLLLPLVLGHLRLGLAGAHKLLRRNPSRLSVELHQLGMQRHPDGHNQLRIPLLVSVLPVGFLHLCRLDRRLHRQRPGFHRSLGRPRPRSW